MKIFFFILFCINVFSTFAQNLVPNPSFENYTQCPTAPGHIYDANFWYQPGKVFGNNVNISSSSDYFNQCANISTQVSVPSNVGGFQTPRTGSAYAGIGCFVMSQDYREYIATSLTSSLVAGKKYCVEFYVNLADSSKYAIGSVGAYFSIDSSLYNATLFEVHLPVIPQVENNPNTFLSDTVNWILVSGSFIAQGGEKFMIIGNFRDSVSTPSQLFNNSLQYPISYYFIEDVSVTCCDTSGNCNPPIDLTSSLATVPNVFTPNNDGTNDVFSITSKNLQDFTLNIYNRWGTLVYSFISPNDAWDGYNTTGEPCSDGVYFYVLSASGTDEKTYNEKGCLQLLR